MSRKKNLGPFMTEGMTVKQIISLGDDTIEHMHTRDLSRAVRTIALAANKRLNRLQKHAIEKNGTFQETGKKLLGIDFNALQSNRSKFGVKGMTSQGALKKEFIRTRNFLNAASSTIEGAIALRKDKERALFGKTREEMISEKIASGQIRNTRGDINKEYRRIDNKMLSIYSNYNKWKEEFGMKGGYDIEEGKNILARLGAMQKSGMRSTSALKILRQEYLQKEKEAEAERQSTARRRFSKVLDPDRLKEQWST